MSVNAISLSDIDAAQRLAEKMGAVDRTLCVFLRAQITDQGARLFACPHRKTRLPSVSLIATLASLGMCTFTLLWSPFYLLVADTLTACTAINARLHRPTMSLRLYVFTSA